MKRIDRLNAILLLLKSKRLVKGEEISREFKISLRTVYRDIQSLMESGVPIFSEAGYGYSLDQDYLMKPLRLSSEEATALYIGGKLAEQMTDRSIQKHTQSAMRKIQSILNEDSRDFIEQIDAKMLVQKKRRLPEEFSQENMMEIIQQAIVSERCLGIHYHSSYRDELSERKIEALGLFFNSDYWHLAAYCRLRKDYRDFRLDRIKKIEVLSDRFKSHHDFNLSYFIASQFETEQRSEIVARFRPEMARHLRNKYYFQSVDEKKDGDWVIFTFHAPLREWIVDWFLSMGKRSEILEPKELIQMTRKRLDEIKSIYTD